MHVMIENTKRNMLTGKGIRTYTYQPIKLFVLNLHALRLKRHIELGQQAVQSTVAIRLVIISIAA